MPAGGRHLRRDRSRRTVIDLSVPNTHEDLCVLRPELSGQSDIKTVLTDWHTNFTTWFSAANFATPPRTQPPFLLDIPPFAGSRPANAPTQRETDEAATCKQLPEQEHREDHSRNQRPRQFDAGPCQHDPGPRHYKPGPSGDGPRHQGGAPALSTTGKSARVPLLCWATPRTTPATQTIGKWLIFKIRNVTRSNLEPYVTRYTHRDTPTAIPVHPQRYTAIHRDKPDKPDKTMGFWGRCSRQF
jgi:hypothetical protein